MAGYISEFLGIVPQTNLMLRYKQQQSECARFLEASVRKS